jgi:hypothetical protein
LDIRGARCLVEINLPFDICDGIVFVESSELIVPVDDVKLQAGIFHARVEAPRYGERLVPNWVEVVLDIVRFENVLSKACGKQV